MFIFIAAAISHGLLVGASTGYSWRELIIRSNNYGGFRCDETSESRKYFITADIGCATRAIFCQQQQQQLEQQLFSCNL
jgi:hypothetical protein